MRPFSIALVFALLVGCGGEEPSPPPSTEDTYVAEPFPTTRFLDAGLTEMISEDRFDGTLVFAGQPTALADVEPGQVLIFQPGTMAPNGLMRFVVSRAEENGNLTLRTVPAPIQLAFRKLEVKAAPRTIERIGERATILGLRPAATIGDKKTIEFYPFNADDDTSTVDDQVRVTGELAGVITYDFGISVDWGEITELPATIGACLISLIEGTGCSAIALLPEIRVGYGITAEMGSTLEVEGVAFDGFEREYTLAKVYGDPILIGPLIFLPELDINAFVRGGASSRFKVRTGAFFTAGAGISFSSKEGIDYMPPGETHMFETPTAEVALGASSQASIGTKLSIKLYDVAGPHTSLRAGAELIADIAQTPCYQLNARLDLAFGFVVAIDVPPLGRVELANWEAEENLLSENVGSGACASPIGANPLPPGSGPDGQHLANPTFTPWSRTLDGALRTFGHTGDSLFWSNLTPSVDGGYVVASAGSSVLSKWKGDGELLWSERFTDREAPGGPEELMLGRVLQLENLSLLVAAQRYVLLELDQNGSLLWSARLHAPHSDENGGPYGDSDKQHRFMGLAADGAGGAFIAASIDPAAGQPAETWILRLNADRTIAWSKRYRSEGSSIYPMSLTRVDDSVLVTGLDWVSDGTFRGWVALIDSTGSVSWAKRLTGPAGVDELEPTTSIRLFDGNLVIAGALGFYRRSFVAAFKTDGTMIWHAVPWTTTDLSYMVIDALAELPTTGLVAAGHYTLGNERGRTFTAGLDVVGRMTWLRGYRFDSAGAESKFASVELTDDGGAIVLSHSTVTDVANGSLWLMKVFAKDGDITFGSGAGDDSTLPFANSDVTISEQLLVLTVSDGAFMADIPDIQIDAAALTVKTQ